MKFEYSYTELGVSPRPRSSIVSVCATAAIAIFLYQSFLSVFTLHPSVFLWKSWPFTSATVKQISEDTSTAFDWASTPTSKHLNFHKCYGQLQCAKLELPLDYWNGTNPNKTISLAVAKVPAKVPVTDPRYGGPILINPGGPGGSGVGFAAFYGTFLQTLVDSPERPELNTAENSTAKYYDIVGFDPRGIGNTSPVAVCFDAGPVSWSWMLREMAEGIIGSSDAALGRLWSMNHALGDTCNRTKEDGDDIKQFITTASVARDMVELIERHGEWKESEARRLISQEAVARSHKTGLCQLPSLPEHLTYKPGEEKLQYWGFSYGSFLGSTFASMFPQRVSRLILDGVVDADDYAQTLWIDNLDDTEKVMQTFYTTCARAGPSRCPLAHPNSVAAEVEARVDAILASLYHNPLPVPGDTPEVISYSDVKLIIFQSLYGPLATFPELSHLLAALERRDGSALLPMLASIHTYSCTRGNGSYDIADQLQQAAQYAIICADGDDQSFLTPPLFDAYWRSLADKSPSTGAIWARIRLRCTGWRIRALSRFAGPFGGETAHPILWVGNSADPVTPVGSARKMAKKFPGSVVLEQDSAGHCSISTPSICTASIILNYLHTGALPALGTVCPPSAAPFGLQPTEPVSLTASELRVLQAQNALQQAWAEGSWGFKGIEGGRIRLKGLKGLTE